MAEGMISIRYVPDPFKDEGRIHLEEKADRLFLSEYIPEYLLGNALRITHSRLGFIEEDLWPVTRMRSGDELILSPNVGEPLTISFSIGTIISNFAAASLAVKLGLLAINAVMYGVIGLSVYAAINAREAELAGGKSPTYGWDGVQTTSHPDLPIPVVYGKQNVGGQILNMYTTTKDDESYLNVLLGLCEGPVKSVAGRTVNTPDGSPLKPTNFSGDQLLINGESITNLITSTEQDDSIGVWVRLGTHDQTSIKGFENVYLPATSPATVSDSAIYSWTTSGSSVEEIVVKFSAPNGLYKTPKKGRGPVHAFIRYRPHDGIDEDTVVSSDSWSYHEADDSKDLSDRTTTLDGAVSAGATIITTDAEGPFRNPEGTTYATARIVTQVTGDDDDFFAYTGELVLGKGAQGIPTTTSGYPYAIDSNHPDGATVITAPEVLSKQSAPQRRDYTIKNLTPDKYVVQIIMAFNNEDDDPDIEQTVQVSFEEVTLDDLNYPYTALIGFRLLAQKQLSGGTPNFSIQVEGISDILQEDASGNQTTGYTRDPIWCTHDMLVKKRYGLGQWITADTNTNMTNLALESTYAVEQIQADDSSGALEARYQFDRVLDEYMPALDVINDFCSSFNCWAFWSGQEIKMVMDRPVTPTQMFTMGNIVKGSFKQRFAPLKDIINRYEIQFYDEDNQYRRDTILVEDSDIADDEDESVRSKTIELKSCTRQSQALRAGRFFINNDKNNTTIIEFSAVSDAISCQPGDVIYFAHDVPQYADHSGRISAAQNVSGDYWVKLHEEITLAAAASGEENYIRIRTNDGTINEYKITAAAGTYEIGDEIAVEGPFTVVPTDYDVYAIANTPDPYADSTDVITATYRILSMKRNNDLSVSIVATEYNSEVYDDTAVTVTTRQYSNLDSNWDVRAVTGVQVLSGGRLDEDGTWRPYVLAHFTIPSYTNNNPFSHVKAYIAVIDDSTDIPELTAYYHHGWTSRGGDWSVRIDGLSGEFSAGDTVYVRLVSVNHNGAELPLGDTTAYSVTVASQPEASPDVSFIIEDSAHTTRDTYSNFEGKELVLRWDWTNPSAVTNKQIAKHDVFMLRTDTPASGDTWTDWRDGDNAITVAGNKGMWTWPVPTSKGPHTYHIVAKDTTGNISDNYDSITLTNPAPAAPTNFEVAQETEDSQNVYGGLAFRWTAVDEPDIIGYEIYIEDSDGIQYYNVGNIAGGELVEHTVAGFDVGETYTAKVRAKDPYQVGAWSNTDTQNPLALPPGFMDFDVPFKDGLTITQDTPSGGVTWNAHSVHYQGVTYSISGSSTTNKYIYWNVSSPNGYQVSNARPSFSGGDWIMILNNDGDGYEAFQQKIIHAAYLQAGTIDTELLQSGAILTGNLSTKGTYTTTTHSSGGGTLNVADTSDFSSSGNARIHDPSPASGESAIDTIAYTGKTGTTLTGVTGMEDHSSVHLLVTPASDKHMEIAQGDNEMHFFGDRGDGTVEDLCNIGLSASGGDTIIGLFGTTSSTNVAMVGLASTGTAIRGQVSGAASEGVEGIALTSGTGIKGESDSGYAVHGVSTSSAGVIGTSTSGKGVIGSSAQSYGGEFVASYATADAAGVANVNIEQTSSGDAVVDFQLTGGQVYRIGIDNSQSDRFCIAVTDDMDSDTAFWITTSGAINLGGDTGEDVTVANDLAVDGGAINSASRIQLNSSGSYTKVMASTYVQLESGLTQHQYFDCGGVFYWRDVDDGDANRMTLNSATGALNISGDLTVTGNNIKDGGGSAAITFDGSQNTTFGGSVESGSHFLLPNNTWVGWDDSGGAQKYNIQVDSSNDLIMRVTTAGRNAIIKDSANNAMLTIADAGSVGNVTVSGDITVTGGNATLGTGLTLDGDTTGNSVIETQGSTGANQCRSFYEFNPSASTHLCQLDIFRFTNSTHASCAVVIYDPNTATVAQKFFAQNGNVQFAGDINLDIDAFSTSSSTINADGSLVINCDDNSDSGRTLDLSYDGSPVLRINDDEVCRIGDADGADYSEFEDDGTLKFVGNATVWDDLRVSVNSLKVPTASNPSWGTYNGFQLLEFDSGENQEVYFTIQLPHSYKEASNITPHVHWILDTDDDGTTVEWGLEYKWGDIGDAMDSATTTIYATEGVSTGDEGKHQITSFSAITGTGMSISSMLLCRLFRRGSGGNDDCGESVWLMEFDTHFEMDTVGSRAITTK